MKRERIYIAVGTWLAALGVSVLFAARAVAAPPPAPGGPHALYYGGDNTAGYPQFTLTDAGDTTDETATLGPLNVRCAPNPFAQQALVQFAARAGERLRVRIYDTRGRLVRTHEALASRTGRQDVTWDGRDAGGRRVAPGVYFYEVQSGVRTARGRLVFIR